MKSQFNNQGFTFIETIVYIAIIGTIVSSFIVFSISISNSRNKTYVVQEVQANARTALNLITQKIRVAKGVNIASSTFLSDPGVLSLSMSSSSLNPTIIDLDQDNGRLRIKEGNGKALPMVSDKIRVTNLVFTNLTASSSRENIGIDLTIEYDNNDTDIEFTHSQSLQTAVSLRQ